MARCRFVEPETVRIALSDGEWIEIACELTAGESREFFGRMRPFVVPGEPESFIAKEVSMARISAYLKDWSLKDRDGKKVPVTDAAIDALDLPTFNEIRKAIEHDNDIREKARVGEKNEQAGSTPSATT